MNDRLTYEELAVLMKNGSQASRWTRRRWPTAPARPSTSTAWTRSACSASWPRSRTATGAPSPADADRCKTPGEFLDLVNNTPVTGV